MKKPGFTLIEVILAMGVLTTTIFIVSGLMLRSLYRVEENRDEIEKTFIIKRELYSHYLNPPKEGKRLAVQKSEEPQITITPMLVEIQDKSSLKKFKKNIKIIRTEAVWKTDRGTRETSMQSFLFYPDKEDEKR